ncbi:uncharacterized protein LOC100275075 isoform 1 [Zea mays]|uniref:Uncharacterized protein n=1 Tax=Zea mays TaxID=4577 RepID=A0A1D6QSN6_MAIZE|nr:uncharacterized protein LOC100275075 isoform 1 [Zea mays]AQK60479.1 hypothetical protein ZEAMMB73_Zm00001d053828 [Zea mays]|eukprot:NP_001142735.2 uncharacterized protein LOC100275075 isoform 1 [Zea mays]
MAKAQAQVAARFMMEAPPPQVVSVMRRRKAPRSLSTIAEDDREMLAPCGSPSDHGHAQVAARFTTEVAPPQVVSVMRRRKGPRSLDTIAEDDREQQLACGSPSDHGLATAWSSLQRIPTPPQPPRERAGGSVTRDLSKNFLDSHGCQQASGWEGGHMLGHRRAVHALELHKVGAC